ncbi:histidine kinase [Nostoc sp. CHAB 5715]|uniref:histidine kinase n=1 Tax=Nostoc sp. CHAB 5715 TaxID=2780400 RepID=UPI001E65173E|nr:histidine kinase [Nostoc sp. CHAB 5715]MCC5623920.1 histidine kinase [Nostoc sp. CHAB 5715]
MGSGEWGAGGDEGDKEDKGTRRITMPNAQCPMPNAQCPMPNAQFPMPIFKIFAVYADAK